MQRATFSCKNTWGLLQSEVEADEWRNILNSEIWDLPIDKSSKLPALRLSYYHLPPQLKRCFAYCSIFPKSYEFKKEKLVLLWMAEGFLQRPSGNDAMEEAGDKYFRELLSRSFFQPSTQKERCFMMRDLINDLSQFASGEFCCKFEHGKPHKIVGKVRHFAYLMGKLDGAEKVEDLMQVRTLRTFLPLTLSNGNCPALSEIVSTTWLPENKH